MDIKKFFHLILDFSLIEMLVGCSPQPMTYSFITTDSAPEPSIDRNTQAKLAETASSVDLSLKELSEIQIATHPHAKIDPPLNAGAVGMDQISSVDWTGPVEPLLKKLATAS